MKHSYLIYLLIHFYAAGIAMSACSPEESYSYRGMAGIHFTSDTLYFSFGVLPFNITDTVIQIPVEILGEVSAIDRTYRFEIDKKIATARAGIHYEEINGKRRIPRHLIHDTIRIRVYRKNLDEHSLYTFSLKLEESHEFPARMGELQRIGIGFSNRLDMPIWWQQLSHWTGEYDPRKYRKFIELHGRPVSEKEVGENPYAILRVFKRVRDFFMENPGYGVIFPDTHWEV